MNEREARYARFRAAHDQLDAALDEAYARDDHQAAFDAFWGATEQDTAEEGESHEPVVRR